MNYIKIFQYIGQILQPTALIKHSAWAGAVFKGSPSHR